MASRPKTTLRPTCPHSLVSHTTTWTSQADLIARPQTCQAPTPPSALWLLHFSHQEFPRLPCPDYLRTFKSRARLKSNSFPQVSLTSPPLHNSPRALDQLVAVLSPNSFLVWHFSNRNTSSLKAETILMASLSPAATSIGPDVPRKDVWRTSPPSK